MRVLSANWQVGRLKRQKQEIVILLWHSAFIAKPATILLNGDFWFSGVFGWCVTFVFLTSLIKTSLLVLIRLVGFFQMGDLPEGL